MIYIVAQSILLGIFICISLMIFVYTFKKIYLNKPKKFVDMNSKTMLYYERQQMFRNLKGNGEILYIRRK